MFFLTYFIMIFIIINILIIIYLFLKKFLRKGIPSTFKGKNILVVGASSGIGFEVASIYSRLGGNVVVAARRLELLEKIPKSSVDGVVDNLKLLQADISTKEGCKNLMESANNHFNNDGIDILFLNSGVTSMVTFGRMIPEDFQGASLNFT